jgi:hypothetical protein
MDQESGDTQANRWSAEHVYLRDVLLERKTPFLTELVEQRRNVGTLPYHAPARIRIVPDDMNNFRVGNWRAWIPDSRCRGKLQTRRTQEDRCFSGTRCPWSSKICLKSMASSTTRFLNLYFWTLGTWGIGSVPKTFGLGIVQFGAHCVVLCWHTQMCFRRICASYTSGKPRSSGCWDYFAGRGGWPSLAASQ